MGSSPIPGSLQKRRKHGKSLSKLWEKGGFWEASIPFGSKNQAGFLCQYSKGDDFTGREVDPDGFVHKMH